MVVVDALHGDSAAAVTDELFVGGADLQAFFDHAALEVKANGGEEGEEELEWLSNKDAFPTVETMAPSAPLSAPLPRKKGVRRPRWEVAWSPPQAPVVAPPQPAGWRCRHCGTETTPQRREGPEGRGTLCNACGVRYRSGRLVPEYRPASSPTFSPEFHSNRHHRVVELRRRREAEAPRASLAAAGNGEEKGNEQLEWLSKKCQVLAAAAVVARPRTEGMRRPRKTVAWPVVAWSPPPPPCSPVVMGQRQSHGGGAGVANERGHVPDGGDHGAGSCTAGDEGRGVVPADGGLNPAAPLAPAAAAGRQFGTEKTLRWLEGPEKSSTLCTACVARCTSGCRVPVQPPASCPITYSPELRFDWHNRVKLHRRLERPSNEDAFPAVKTMLPAAARPQTKSVRRRRRAVELSPPRTPPPPRRRSRCGGEPAADVEQGRVGDGGTAAVVEGRAAAPADTGEELAAPWAAAVSGWQCRHCGTEKTPQWREGPEGRHTLCNACGVRYRSGRLVPEYRPATAPPSPRVCTPTCTARSSSFAAVGTNRPWSPQLPRLSPEKPPQLRPTSEGRFLLDD